MRPAIDAFQEDNIDLAEQFFNGAHDLHLEIIAQLLGVAGHPIATARHVRAAPREGGHHATPARSPVFLGSSSTLVNATTCDVSRPMMPARNDFPSCPQADGAAEQPTRTKTSRYFTVISLKLDARLACRPLTFTRSFASRLAPARRTIDPWLMPFGTADGDGSAPRRCWLPLGSASTRRRPFRGFRSTCSPHHRFTRNIAAPAGTASVGHPPRARTRAYGKSKPRHRPWHVPELAYFKRPVVIAVLPQEIAGAV